MLDEDIIKQIDLPEEKLKRFLKDVEAEGSEKLKEAVIKNPQLSQAWKVLDEASIGDVMKRNPKALETISSAQKGEFGTSLYKVGNRVTIKSGNGDDLLRFEGDQLKVGKHDINADPNNTSFKNVDEVNGSYPEGWEAPYDASVPPVEFKTASNEQFVRVFTEGINNPNGRWIMKKSDIEGLTPAQIKDKFAIPGDDLPNKIVDVNIPEGTRIRTGKAAATSGGNGGGTQFELPYPDGIDENWFINEKTL
jgi:hypothetical protein